MNTKKYSIRKLPRPLRNKYFILFILFLFWIILLDDYNLITQNKIKKKVTDLKNQKAFYINEIKYPIIVHFKIFI